MTDTPKLSATSEKCGLGRFVVLHHDWPVPHRDLILDLGGSGETGLLPTWALYTESDETPALPDDGSSRGAAIRLADHRRVYLDYEGDVAGERGRVIRESWGSVLEVNSTCTATVASERIYRLSGSDRSGRKLEGTLVLFLSTAGGGTVRYRTHTLMSDAHRAADVGWNFRWQAAAPQ